MNLHDALGKHMAPANIGLEKMAQRWNIGELKHGPPPPKENETTIRLQYSWRVFTMVLLLYWRVNLPSVFFLWVFHQEVADSIAMIGWFLPLGFDQLLEHEDSQEVLLSHSEVELQRSLQENIERL